MCAINPFRASNTYRSPVRSISSSRTAVRPAPIKSNDTRAAICPVGISPSNVSTIVDMTMGWTMAAAVATRPMTKAVKSGRQ